MTNVPLAVEVRNAEGYSSDESGGRRVVRQPEANPGVEDHAFVDLIGDGCQHEQSSRLGIVPADAADLTLQGEAPGQAVGSR
jgi:hypothetical protein